VALTPKNKNETAVMQSAEDFDLTERSPVLRAVTMLENDTTIRKDDPALIHGEVRLSHTYSRDTTMGQIFKNRDSSYDYGKDPQCPDTALIDSRISIPIVNIPDQHA